jgi:hypothetical protein
MVKSNAQNRNCLERCFTVTLQVKTVAQNRNRYTPFLFLVGV